MRSIKSEIRNPGYPLAGAAIKNIVHYRVIIRGIVQGVGFRPFIYKLAKTCRIKGSVLNSSQGVIIEAEGKSENITFFLKTLKEHPPVLSRISGVEESELPPVGFTSFDILVSNQGQSKEALIPPDIATCKACRKEILNPTDRHYLYPFTNCTNCGPRFTIIREIPYDRPETSMKAFVMCAECAEEYHNPSDRRFHAQPVACPACGPHIEIAEGGEQRAEGQGSRGAEGGEQRAENRDNPQSAIRNPQSAIQNPKSKIQNRDAWLDYCWEMLSQGKILALKSLGGFHLVCDAKNRDALKTLRLRKGRKAKPFAVMCKDMKAVRKYCFAGKDEARLLASPEAPILILKKKLQCSLPEELAPQLTSLGVMLPYTPLHILLFNGPFDLLVMTSGNYTGLPLVIDNEAALNELGHIADFFIFHNREIVNRCDDSLLQIVDGETLFFRRSRGYVPYPVTFLRGDDSPAILGVGAEMKNNFCILKKDQAFMSQYIGEIDNLEGENNFLGSIKNFEGLLGVIPEIVAYDAHPGYASSRIARTIPAKTYIEVQHHHAHLASCMAENGIDNEEAIGVILDGTGYGTDGNLWGFEILTGNYVGFRRFFHLAYVPLPGGEIAIREPWRTGYSYLVTFLGDEGRRHGRVFFNDHNTGAVEQLITKNFNTPLSSGCGRLFDAVSAILGVCYENTYEGQAAIELGEAALKAPENTLKESYSFTITRGKILPGKVLEGIIHDRLAGVSVETISAKFHNTIVSIVCDVVERVSSITGLKNIVLSGGTWQNGYLLRKAKTALNNLGYGVLYHRQVPANDGGIALGQAAIAYWKWKKQ